MYRIWAFLSVLSIIFATGCSTSWNLVDTQGNEMLVEGLDVKKAPLEGSFNGALVRWDLGDIMALNLAPHQTIQRDGRRCIPGSVVFEEGKPINFDKDEKTFIDSDQLCFYPNIVFTGDLQDGHIEIPINKVKSLKKVP